MLALIHILLSNYLESRRRIGVVFQIRWADVTTKGAVTKKGIGKGREQRRKKEPSKVRLFFLRPGGKL